MDFWKTWPKEHSSWRIGSMLAVLKTDTEDFQDYVNARERKAKLFQPRRGLDS
jgi:hypothetical protein